MKIIKPKSLREFIRGDIVRNTGSGDSYVVERSLADEVIAFRSVYVSNVSEWEIIVVRDANEGKESEIERAKEILRSSLDRDIDLSESLETLVTVACNALHWARRTNDANEKEEAVAVKADKIQDDPMRNAYVSPYAKTATEAAQSCDQSETFCWKTAAILIGRGEEVQVKACGRWIDFDINHITISFPKDFLYRRKPSPATPDKKEMVVRMHNSSIFTISDHGESFFKIMDNCDGRFADILSPQELWKLGAEMMQMANEKVNNDGVKIPPLPLSSVKGKN